MKLDMKEKEERIMDALKDQDLFLVKSVRMLR